MCADIEEQGDNRQGRDRREDVKRWRPELEAARAVDRAMRNGDEGQRQSQQEKSDRGHAGPIVTSDRRGGNRKPRRSLVGPFDLVN